MLHQLALTFLLVSSAVAQNPLTDEPEVEAPSLDALEQATELALDEAIARFEAFLEANPEGGYSTMARFRLASLLMTRAEEAAPPPAYGPAVEQLERVVAAVEQGQAGEFAQAAEAWYLLGWCLRDLGPTRAAEAWQRVVVLAPGSELAASSLLHLGNTAMDAADWAQAGAHFQAARAAQADPATTAQATYLAGWASYKLDQWGPAAEAFAAVLAQDQPSTLHAEALEYLVLVLVERCEAEGLSVANEADDALASLPAAWHAAFLDRCATVLEGMARFDEADALRARATRGERKERKRRRKDQD